MTKTRQEIFNIVATHLLTQKKQCMVTKGIDKKCLYRGRNGLKCAIGALIPDSSYSKELEETMAHGLPEDVYLAMDINIDDGKFLDYLQDIHDLHTPNKWREQLIIFTEKNSLDASAVHNVA